MLGRKGLNTWPGSCTTTCRIFRNFSTTRQPVLPSCRMLSANCSLQAKENHRKTQRPSLLEPDDKQCFSKWGKGAESPAFRSQAGPDSERPGQQLCGYLVNMLRKVWMICSVKGTPICTLRPRNKVRKKLSISSVTSKWRTKQTVNTVCTGTNAPTAWSIFLCNLHCHLSLMHPTGRNVPNTIRTNDGKCKMIKSLLRTSSLGMLAWLFTAGNGVVLSWSPAYCPENRMVSILTENEPLCAHIQEIIQLGQHLNALAFLSKTNHPCSGSRLSG